ncbi:outer membrane transport energization protein ExbB [Hydrogenispora ethanolica]|uniref:Outer membrane transport energization protein ExbB n=2 Tax=Hydrogenispora ethanolica TaxID=1082276 RepID=A0A4R1RVV2_HYDET|nr:outer membrane transport energization protein ExbB [Hydrogenispora ethanolica]
MAPLGICSLVAVTIIVERLIFFRRTGFRQPADEVLALVRQGRHEEALAKADGNQLPVVKVLQAGLSHRRNPGKAMEAAGLAEISGMKRGLTALETIITLSPLLGLLGTIIGMIGSFQIMTLAGSSQPHAVTGGVAEALIATASGITVAVVTLIPYNYFLRRVEQETETIEQYATRLELAFNEPLPERAR